MSHCCLPRSTQRQRLTWAEPEAAAAARPRSRSACIGWAARGSRLGACGFQTAMQGGRAEMQLRGGESSTVKERELAELA